MLLMAKPKPKPTAFGVRLKALRIAAGLGLAELGEAIGVDRQAIYRLENSPKANPTLATLQALALALNCTPNDLIPLDEPQG